MSKEVYQYSFQASLDLDDVRLFTGYLAQEYGEQAFAVERPHGETEARRS